MGLDMYLERYPRVEGVTRAQISALEDWLDWRNDEKAAGSSFSEWTGRSETELPDARHGEMLKKFLSVKYWAWDTEHRYPHERIYEQVGYWRKANAIHKWFVDHVQDGVDDCGYHDEVTKEVLEELRDTCKEVLDKVVLVNGPRENGKRLVAGKGWQPVYEDGLVVLNAEVCHELLPTTSGFFFGGTQYNDGYMYDVRETYELCEKLLAETDFDNFALYYCSSW